MIQCQVQAPRAGCGATSLVVCCIEQGRDKGMGFMPVHLSLHEMWLKLHHLTQQLYFWFRQTLTVRATACYNCCYTCTNLSVRQGFISS